MPRGRKREREPVSDSDLDEEEKDEKHTKKKAKTKQSTSTSPKRSRGRPRKRPAPTRRGSAAESPPRKRRRTAAARDGTTHRTQARAPRTKTDPEFKMPPRKFLLEVREELVKLHAKARTHEGWEISNRGFGGKTPIAEYRKTVVRAASFKGRRIRQICRWASTTTFIALALRGLEKAAVVEVQATVYPPNDADEATFYISANGPDGINAMGGLFNRGTAGSVLARLAEEASKARAAQPVKRLRFGPRTSRHPEELAEFLRAAAAGRHPAGASEADATAYQVVAAAMGRRARVATAPSTDAAGHPRRSDRTHAERRLREEIRKHRHDKTIELNMADVGGMMRPCVFCYLALYAHDKSGGRVGPAWFTAAAAKGLEQHGKNAKEVAKYIHQTITTAGVQTARTQLPGSKTATTEVDSESESEKEYESDDEYDADDEG